MQPLTLTEIWTSLCLRWRTVLGGAALGLLLGTIAHLAVPTSYAATTIVQVEGSEPARIDMAVEEAFANSRRVGIEALATLDDDHLDIDALEDAVTARAVARSRVLRVTFVDPRAREASRGADAVAQAYLAVRTVEAGPLSEVGGVIDPARVPRSPSGPGRRGWLAGGLALGLLLAVPWAARPARRAPVSRSPAVRAS